MLNRRFLQWVLENGKVAVSAKNARGFGGNENSAFHLFLDLLETQRNPSLSDPLPDLYRSSTPVSERRSENRWDQPADLRVVLAIARNFSRNPALFVTALASSNTAEIALAPRSVIASTAVFGKSTF